MNRVQLLFALVFSAAAATATWFYLPQTGISLIDLNRAVICAVIGLLFTAMLLKIFIPLLSMTQHRHDPHVLPELDVSEQKKVVPTEFKPLGLESTIWQKDGEIFCTACGAKVGRRRHCHQCGERRR